MNLTELLIWLLTIFFTLFFLGAAPVSRPVEPPTFPTPTPFEAQSAAARSETIIDNVEVIVLESFPMQVQLHVTGTQPDGCELPVIVEQSREDNSVTVEIYREVPGDVFCPMVLLPYEDTIMIEGNFEPGEYVFRVNGFVVETDL